MLCLFKRCKNDWAVQSQKAKTNIDDPAFKERVLKRYVTRFLPECPANMQIRGNCKNDSIRVLNGLYMGSQIAAESEKKGQKHKTTNTHTAYSSGMIRALATWSALKEMKRKNASEEVFYQILAENKKRYERKYHVVCSPVSRFDSSLALGCCVVGAFSDDPEQVIRLSALSAYEPDWDFEGLRGSIVSSVCVWLALHGATEKEIYDYAVKHYGDETAPVEYRFSHGRITVEMTMDDFLGMPSYQLTDGSCMIVVPEALSNFFHGHDFVASIRMAKTFPCDIRQVTALTGALAGAFYQVPETLIQKYSTNFPVELRTSAQSITHD